MKLKKFFKFLHHYTKKKENPIKISGTFLYFDTKNGNGRIYPQKLAGDILSALQNDIKNGNVLGELGFPERFEVSLANVSHIVEEVHFNSKQNSIEGTIRVLEGTPNGNRLLNMIDYDPEKFNKMFVVRSRGAGTVNENGEVENYKLYSFDIIPKDQDSFKNIQQL